MSEFIIIQVGQCGNQIGSCLLPQILEEYGLREDSTNAKSKINTADFFHEYMSSFFSINNSKRTSCNSIEDLVKLNVKARIICIDMEDSVVARFKMSKFKDLFDKRNLITNYPGSGNNWADGHCNHGPKYEDKILTTIQYNVEKCDNLHGFLLMFSTGGGTGSGLGTYIVKLLADNYPTVERFVVCVYPTGTEDVITCPYNMAFATQVLLDNATCAFPIENQALLDILLRQTNRFGTKFKHTLSLLTPFEDMNSIIANMILHLTSGSRFPGTMNIDMNEINTNMVPFPKVNFLSSGFGPLSFKFYCDNSKSMKNEVFLYSLSRNSQLVRVDPLDSRHKCLALTLLGRGKYSLDDIRNSLSKIQSKLKFPCWSQKAIKLGLCNVAPKGMDHAAFALINTTSMSNLFQNVHGQFLKLYRRKAHVHHYTEIPGFELNDFEICHNSFLDIIELYKDIPTIKPSCSWQLSDL